MQRVQASQQGSPRDHPKGWRWLLSRSEPTPVWDQTFESQWAVAWERWSRSSRSIPNILMTLSTTLVNVAPYFRYQDEYLSFRP
jgi:hypothetical protein